MPGERANDKLSFVREQLAELKDEGLYTTIRSLSSGQGAWLEIEGRRVLNFCSNNYLGLANHPRLVERAKQAMDRFGVGPAAVRTIAGTMDLHLELEERLANFKEVAAAIQFQSGYNANVAVIPALVGDQDAVISDELNHASIIDGIRLTKADRYIYSHTDMDDLRSKLEEAAGQDYRAILLVTDGVFSMDGDIAPLDEITELAEEFDAITMVDDAHGEGVLGRGGRGIVDHFDLHGRVDIEVGTLSKAFGVVGGYVAGNATVVEWLRQRGRPFLFSSATTVPDTAACLASVDLLEESTDRVDRLWENARYFQNGMQELGFDTGKTQTPITPIMLGAAPLAQKFSQRLFEEGVFGTAIGYPTVPMGQARIRVMISAAHEQEDLDFGLEKFEKVGQELEVI